MFVKGVEVLIFPRWLFPAGVVKAICEWPPEDVSSLVALTGRSSASHYSCSISNGVTV